MTRDYSLYLCTDQVLAGSRPILEAVEQAISGGVTMVQIREKTASTKDFYETALQIHKITQRHGVPLIVNDRIDIALAVGAEGLHLGQTDMPIAVARKLVRQNMFIGISTHTVEEALLAQEQGADYLGIGPVFPTETKPGITPDKTLGVEGLKRICDAISIPSVAIGGVGASNAAAVMGAGVSGLAVISAILAQPDIAAAARAIREQMQ